MTTETLRRKIITCSGTDDHIHEMNFMVVESAGNLTADDPNRFIKDEWNCYLFFTGKIDIYYKDIGLDVQLIEKDRVMAYIDADTTGYVSYTVVDENNITVHFDANWYPKNQMIDYEHSGWLSAVFDNRIFQVLGSDVIAQRIFLSQKKFNYVQDNVREYMEGYSTRYKFSYCILEANNEITFDMDRNKYAWFLGADYTVNGLYMDDIDQILEPIPQQVVVNTMSDSCYIVLVEKL